MHTRARNKSAPNFWLVQSLDDVGQLHVMLLHEHGNDLALHIVGLATNALVLGALLAFADLCLAQL